MPSPFLIDSHCHIHNTADFDSTPEEIITRAEKNGIRQMIVIGTSHADSLSARDFAEKYDNIFWSYGIHPSEAENLSISGSMSLRAQTIGSTPVTTGGGDRCPTDRNSRKCVAIGEVGLDYHYRPYDRSAQIALLEEMLALSKSRDLPLIFHVREAFDDFFPIVDNQHITRAVVHSFSDNKQNLEQALSRGFYIGVNGLATFADIPLPPLERMLLETDAPYLTPVPFRGKINESAYIKDIADYLAVKLGVSREEIARKTTQNVQVLFQLPQPVVRPA